VTRLKLIDIAFDLDGVLVDIMHVIRKCIKEEHGAKVLPHDSWKILTEPQISDHLIWNSIKSAYKRVDEVPFYKGAKEILLKLHELSDGDPVKIVTARPPKIAANDTYKLVGRLCDFPYELAIVSSHNKLPYLTRYKYFVEDRRRSALRFSKSKKMYLVDRPYNKIPNVPRRPNITRIRGVYDLIPIAERFIKDV
jgi:phosphoglycolate phosphatase-like HAD superfamily hydrolase